MISEHISYNEATNSPTALRLKIRNEPSADELEAMKVVAMQCFEPLRQWYGKPIKINSFFRSQDLNSAVGGAKYSQHSKGEAIDISAGSKEENEKLFNWCKGNLVYDQLINEYDFSWVHISFSRYGNRNQILIIK